MLRTKYVLLLITLIFTTAAMSQRPLDYMDAFNIEFATSPQIAPDGSKVIYVRNYFDKMTDRRRTELWLADLQGSVEPLLPGMTSYSAGSPRWSPDGKRVAFISSDSNGKAQIFVYWVETGKIGRVTSTTNSPSGLSWSPDGKWLGYFSRVPKKSTQIAKMPSPPKGAKWAKKPRVVDTMRYRSDGAGFIPLGRTHFFIVPSNGGTSKQVTKGDFNYGGRVAWAKDMKSVFMSSNQSSNPDLEVNNSDIFRVNLVDGQTTKLTNRVGPDSSPFLAPDGNTLGYVGFDDKKLGYHNSVLSLLNVNNGNTWTLTETLDRSVSPPQFDKAGKRWLFTYSDRGETKLATVDQNSNVTVLASGLGSNGNVRPYGGGAGFTVSDNGTIAYTKSSATRPGDLFVLLPNGTERMLTDLSRGLLDQVKLGEVKEINYKSSHDQLDIQGWYILPPDFDSSKKYPLILEIHGGPFSDYGARFTNELQMMAAKGYVVLYTNPRGSTSYGAKFANEIHHNYPGNDYDDLISGVDAMIKKGFIDEDRLYVTGGSGGGVLTAEIIGKTNRFKAAVVAKPVINWFSFSLTADGAAFFTQYWFSGMPWDKPDEYYKRSPIRNVGKVSTPTMLLTGESDLRTPISESEQYYQALKLRGVDTVMVRIPGAGHGITARPSQFIAKVANIIGWFEKYK